MPAGALALLPVLVWGEEPVGQALFEARCGLCHSLEVPQSQRLDRATWEWVIDDMVNKFGASFITPEEQKVILEYLVANHGPG